MRPVVQGTVVVLENKTGRILAMSGGFSYPLSQLNRATQAVRQPGSAIKPLSYLAALGRGLQPNTLISDGAITLPPIKGGRALQQDYWSPKNYDGGGGGTLTLRRALENSRNLATAHLLLGGIADKPEASLDLLCRLALEAQIYHECVRYYPFVLGAQPVRPVDLAAFYAAIANEGLRPSPYVIESIERGGRMVYRHDPSLRPDLLGRPRRLLSAQDAMGRQRGDISIAALSHSRWSPAMTKRKTETVNDLSRCLDPLDMDATLIAVIEMSQSSWLVAGIVPGVERQPLKKLAIDEHALLKLLSRWRAEAEKKGHRITRIAVAFEAGHDGFWLARWLAAQGVEAHVIHASSVAVTREHRRAKTDRLDTELLKRGFLGWLRGERGHCKMVAVPTLAEEDAKRPSRERETLVGEASRIITRVKAAFVRLGIRSFNPKLKAARRAPRDLTHARG